jgi:hypothetical protein
MDLSTVRTLWTVWLLRFEASRDADRDAGEVSLTTVIMAFVLAGLAISVGAIIVNKVTAKANGIPLD